MVICLQTQICTKHKKTNFCCANKNQFENSKSTNIKPLTMSSLCTLICYTANS